MKVIKSISNDIPISELMDGRLAIITRWEISPGCEGRIVQRYGNALVSIGMNCGNAWNIWFQSNPGRHDDVCRVKVLEPGTQLEVE